MRVEVSVRREDALLVRRVADALSDPTREARARNLLNEGLAQSEGLSLKALLAAAPLEDIELERDTRPGRDVDL